MMKEFLASGSRIKLLKRRARCI